MDFCICEDEEKLIKDDEILNYYSSSYSIDDMEEFIKSPEYNDPTLKSLIYDECLYDSVFDNSDNDKKMR